MTREEAKEILRHWDDVVWKRRDTVTLDQLSDAVKFVEEASDRKIPFKHSVRYGQLIRYLPIIDMLKESTIDIYEM